MILNPFINYLKFLSKYGGRHLIFGLSFIYYILVVSLINTVLAFICFIVLPFVFVPNTFHRLFPGALSQGNTMSLKSAGGDPVPTKNALRCLWTFSEVVVGP
jgi:hypothetical protein